MAEEKKKRKWLIIIAVSLALLLFSAYQVKEVLHNRKRRLKWCCNKIEATAEGIAASVSEYYANPAHVGVPTLEDLEAKGFLDWLDKKYYLEASITGTVDHILISVVADPDICPCPRGDKFSVHMTENFYHEWTRIPK